MYLAPAAERAERLWREGGRPGAAGSPAQSRLRAVGKSSGPDFEPGTPGHRAQIVHAFMSVMGMSRTRAEAQYERQLAQWRAEEAVKG